MVLVGKVSHVTNEDFVLLGADNTEVICEIDKTDLNASDGDNITVACTLSGTGVIRNGVLIPVLRVEEVM